MTSQLTAEGGVEAKVRVVVVYHIFPHYREGVIRELVKNAQYSFTFAGSEKAYEGIPIMDMTGRNFISAPFIKVGKLIWQNKALTVSVSGKYDVYVFLSNPYFVSTWFAAAIARLRGKRVIFWGHGWLRSESSAKWVARSWYYRLANTIMVYNERAKRLGTQAGFPEARISVIYNSVHLSEIENTRLQLLGTSKQDVYPFFELPLLPVLVCSTRLTPACKLEVLFDAVENMRESGVEVNILIIGAGPEEESLRAKAKHERARVHWFGACYDEKRIGRLIYHADLTVVPGKVGLTAIHSLSYGTPTISHSDMDYQMPEAEAIEVGVSGSTFQRNNSIDLANTIVRWLREHPDRDAVRRACIGIVESKWCPRVQSRLIEDVLRMSTRESSSQT